MGSALHFPLLGSMSFMLLSPILWALIGGFIGAQKDKTTLGVILGLLLGPIGVVIIALIQKSGPKCPACGKPIFKGANRCSNCGIGL